jgi:acetolactate synthase regulatory subunit
LWLKINKKFTLKTMNLCIEAVVKSNRALGFVPPEIVERVLGVVIMRPNPPADDVC